MCTCNKCRNFGKKKSCDFVKDKICCHWSVPSGESRIVYLSTGVNVFASGYVTFECGEADSIIVRFYNNGTQVGQEIAVSQGSCTTFTAANFTSIEVECLDMGEDDDCTGEICITPRYQVSCDDEFDC